MNSKWNLYDIIEYTLSRSHLKKSLAKEFLYTFDFHGLPYALAISVSFFFSLTTHVDTLYSRSELRFPPRTRCRQHPVDDVFNGESPSCASAISHLFRSHSTVAYYRTDTTHCEFFLTMIECRGPVDGGKQRPSFRRKETRLHTFERPPGRRGLRKSRRPIRVARNRITRQSDQGRPRRPRAVTANDRLPAGFPVPRCVPLPPPIGVALT